MYIQVHEETLVAVQMYDVRETLVTLLLANKALLPIKIRNGNSKV